MLALGLTLVAARAKRVATVVLDTPPRSETAALEAARAADLVIVPCRPQIVDLETVPTTIQVLALARGVRTDAQTETLDGPAASSAA